MLIETKNLTHIYMPGTQFQVEALKNVNIRIEPGEFVGIIGETGSGKSTLIQHLNGLLTPTNGSILIDGKELERSSANLRRLRQRVGLLFQFPEHQLFEETVYNDVAFGPKNMGLSEEEIAIRVREALSLVDMDFEQFKDRSPFELSGGQMRRVAIAGVMAMEPEVLILDEPTAGLDPEGRRVILEQIKKIHHQKKLSVILVSHSMEDVSRLADRLYVIHQGRIVLSRTPAEVFSERSRLEGYGLALPPIAELMQKLKEKGKAVRTNIFTITEARRELLSLQERRKGDV